MINWNLIENWRATEQAQLISMNAHKKKMVKNGHIKALEEYGRKIACQEGMVLALTAVLLEAKKAEKEEYTPQDKLDVQSLCLRATDL